MGLSGSKFNTEEFLLKQIHISIDRAKLPGSRVLRFGGKCVIEYPDASSLQIIPESDIINLRKLRLTFKQSICQNFPLVESEVLIPSSPKYFVARCREPVGTTKYIDPKDVLPDMNKKNLRSLAFQIMFACDQLSKVGLLPDPSRGFMLRENVSGSVMFFTPQYVHSKESHVQKMYNYKLIGSYVIIFNGFMPSGYIFDPDVPKMIEDFLGRRVSFNPDEYRKEVVEWNNIPCFSVPLGEDISSHFTRPSFFIKPKSPTVLRKQVSTSKYIEDMLQDFLIDSDAWLSVQAHATWPDGDETLGGKKLRSREELQQYINGCLEKMKAQAKDYEESVLKTIKTVEPYSPLIPRLSRTIAGFKKDIEQFENNAVDEYETLLSFQDLIESFECVDSYAHFLVALGDLRLNSSVDLNPYLEELDYHEDSPRDYYEKIRKVPGTEEFRRRAYENLKKIIPKLDPKRRKWFEQTQCVLEKLGEAGNLSREEYLREAAKLGKPECDDEIAEWKRLGLFLWGLNTVHTVGQISIFRDLILGVPKVVTEQQIDVMKKEEAIKKFHEQIGREEPLGEGLIRVVYPQNQQEYLEHRGLEYVELDGKWVVQVKAKALQQAVRTEEALSRYASEHNQPELAAGAEARTAFPSSQREYLLSKGLQITEDPASGNLVVEKIPEPRAPPAPESGFFGALGSWFWGESASSETPKTETPKTETPKAETPKTPKADSNDFKSFLSPKTVEGAKIVAENLEKVEELTNTMNATTVLLGSGNLSEQQVKDTANQLFDAAKERTEAATVVNLVEPVLEQRIASDVEYHQKNINEKIDLVSKTFLGIEELADETQKLLKKLEEIEKLSTITPQKVIKEVAPEYEPKNICVYVPSGFGDAKGVGAKLKTQIGNWMKDIDLSLNLDEGEKNPVFNFRCSDEQYGKVPTLVLVAPGGRKQESIANFDRYVAEGKFRQPIALFAESQNTPGSSAKSFIINKQGEQEPFSITTLWELAEITPFIMDNEFNRDLFQTSVRHLLDNAQIPVEIKKK